VSRYQIRVDVRNLYETLRHVLKDSNKCSKKLFFLLLRHFLAWYPTPVSLIQHVSDNSDKCSKIIYFLFIITHLRHDWTHLKNTLQRCAETTLINDVIFETDQWRVKGIKIWLQHFYFFQNRWMNKSYLILELLIK
jgi:hypothetical protein